MPDRRRTLDLTSPDETAALGRRFARLLSQGDVLLLSGGIGSGKTHFARSLILSLLPEPEDVPSPTFTLVQTYDADAMEIWHADLYRITGPEETIELGLIDAFETAVVLIEWPDRLGPLAPADAMSLDFAVKDAPGSRRLDLTWSDPRWDEFVEQVTGDA